MLVFIIFVGLFRDERSGFYNIYLVIRFLDEIYYLKDVIVFFSFLRDRSGWWV